MARSGLENSIYLGDLLPPLPPDTHAVSFSPPRGMDRTSYLLSIQTENRRNDANYQTIYIYIHRMIRTPWDCDQAQDCDYNRLCNRIEFFILFD